MSVVGSARGLLTMATALAVVTLTACGGDASGDRSSGVSDTLEDAAAARLGPVDGRDLAGVDLDRVAVGDPAPDFSLMSYRGDVLTLSENRGERDVLLVFYRGHW